MRRIRHQIYDKSCWASSFKLSAFPKVMQHGLKHPLSKYLLPPTLNTQSFVRPQALPLTLSYIATPQHVPQPGRPHKRTSRQAAAPASLPWRQLCSSWCSRRACERRGSKRWADCRDSKIGEDSDAGKMYGEREGGGADVNVVRLMVEWWRGW